jgi:diketogulonate reductase-like aldo/keto reductase
LTASSDLRMTRIPLSRGAGHMPALGFGTLIPDAAVTITATRDALETGFRHFDCAERYGNEREIGRALQEGLATEVFPVDTNWALLYVSPLIDSLDIDRINSTRGVIGIL